MDIVSEDKLYKTTDINIAIVLFYLGHDIDSIDKTNPSKAIFVFKKENGLEEDIKDFWGKGLSVEPYQLLNICSKEVKNRLYNSIEY